MALGLATFRSTYPEFVHVPDVNAQAALDLAEGKVDRDVLDAASENERGDEVVGLYAAAHLRRQMGQAAKGPADDYETMARDIVRALAAIYRVI